MAWSSPTMMPWTRSLIDSRLARSGNGGRPCSTFTWATSRARILTNRSSRASLSYAIGRSMTIPRTTRNERLFSDRIRTGNRRQTERSAPVVALQPAGHQQGLAAHVVAVGTAEQIDCTSRLGGRPPAAERDHLAHRGQTRPLHADAHLAPLDLDAAGLAFGQGLGQARLDVAERHAVHRDVIAPPLLGERLRDTDDRRLAGRVVHLSGVAIGPGRGRHV